MKSIQKVAKLIGYVLENLHVSENGVGSIILTEELWITLVLKMKIPIK